MKILVTGGTVFVSKFVASYFVKAGHEVFVLNRGTKEQVKGINLIQADRNELGNCLDGMFFDTIVDISAYNKKDIENLLSKKMKFDNYFFISTSAVYAETLEQPFNEDQPTGGNSLWGAYGENKLEAEHELLSKVPDAYILRPPYLYGPMQNLYRELFVFDQADKKRKFYVPKNGTMKLQFLHIEDLCKIIENIIETKPEQHIFNVGNAESVSINKFVELCYEAAGADLEKVFVFKDVKQQDYFPFSDYEYTLDVTRMCEILPVQKDLLEGLKESYIHHKKKQEKIKTKAYTRFINKNF